MAHIVTGLVSFLGKAWHYVHSVYEEVRLHYIMSICGDSLQYWELPLFCVKF